MKEKLIAFTRNKKNVVWIIVALILIGVVGMNLQNLLCTPGFLLLEIAIRCILIIALCFVYGMYQLFKIEEEKIRKNSLFLILLSLKDYVWLPILAIENIIYAIIATIAGFPMNIISFICLLVVAVFLGNIVSKYFSKK